MAVICDNTGVPVGSETCKLCVSHCCEGYKQATKQDKQRENLQKKDCAKMIATLKIFIRDRVVSWKRPGKAERKEQ